MNDPNGLIQVDGVYHLFYQFHRDPCPAEWWRKDWGHATSLDLVTWQDQPISLQPGAGRADSDGCWSGCAVEADDEIRIYYTGVVDQMVQRICLARARRDLAQLVPQAAALDVAGVDYHRGRTFRDPYVWREGHAWRALIAGTFPESDSHQGVLQLESDDGLAWRPKQQKVAVPVDSNLVIECPNRFIIDGREVLLCSAQPLWTALYRVGHPADTPAVSEMKLLMSASRFYAPLVFRDAKGRLIMMGYCEEARSFASIAAAGWCNVQSLPIELTLSADDQLLCRPVAELTQLRGAKLHEVQDVVLGETPCPLEGLSGNQCEIECAIECGRAEKIFIDVLADPACREFTRIEIDARSGGLRIDSSRSSLDPSTANQGDNDRQGPVKTDWNFAPPDGRIRLRIFVDRSIVDVFSDAGVFNTQRAYPSLRESSGVRISALGSGAKLIHATGWSMEDCSPARVAASIVG